MLYFQNIVPIKINAAIATPIGVAFFIAISSAAGVADA